MTSIILVAAEEEVNGAELFFPAVYDIVWSLVPFALVLLFFWKWGMPMMTKILDERAAKIEGGIERAEKAQAEADERLNEYQELLTEARTEAASIREQARVDGQEILAELKTKAQDEADRIVKNAHVQIEAERQAALISLKSEVGSLALDLASGVIGETLSEDKRAKSVVDRFLSEMEKSK